MTRRTLNILTITLLLLFGNSCFKSKFIGESTEFDGPEINHPKLPVLDSLCITNEEFKVGMRIETVKFLIGEPKDIIVEGNTERWVYKRREVRKKYGIRGFIIDDNGKVNEIIYSE